MASNPPETAAISVSQLNRRVKALIESGMTRLWVEGELSNLSRPASGHIYFSLKDDNAQVSAAWFRQRQRGPANAFKNGDRVLAYGRVSLYEARGNYQLIVEQMEAAGEGVLKRRFDALKRKLEAEGLFESARKQAIPTLPTRIGVITSPSGAALHDILSVLGRRFPAVPVTVYPAAVQGDAAPAELIAALDKASERNECDVIIIGRGGGSLEDLWGFNDEQLARTIAACKLPIISAVGHEVDFTIADFVADVRAPTPSGAAEIAVPSQAEWSHRLAGFAARIARVGERTLEDRAQQLDWLAKRLAASSPAAHLQRQRSRLSENAGRMHAAIRHLLLSRSSDLQRSEGELRRLSPVMTIQRSRARLDQLQRSLSGQMRTTLSNSNHELALLGRALHAVSPLATLQRGYAIACIADSGAVLTNAKSLQVGDHVTTRLAKGSFAARVTELGDDD